VTSTLHSACVHQMNRSQQKFSTITQKVCLSPLSAGRRAQLTKGRLRGKCQPAFTERGQVLRCSRQGCESWGVQVFPLSIARFGRLAYLDHREVTNGGVPRSRSHGCPTPGKGVAVGATGVASKLAGLNMTKGLQPRKDPLD
jgi:hypothetical protein